MDKYNNEVALLYRLLHWCKTGQCDPELDDELNRIFQRLRNAFVRGSAAGGVLRGGLHLFSLVLRVLSSRRKSRHSGSSLSSAEILKDTARWMAFLGCLGGAYVTVDEGLAAVLGKKRTSGWRALIAGACAGPFILLTGSDTRHYSLATYVFVRSLTLLVRCGNKADAPALVQRVLAPTRFEHGDTLLMCAAASQILYSYVCFPQTLPNSYVRFLNRQAALEQYVWNAIRETMARNLAGSPAAPLQALKGTPHAHHCSKIPCSVIHPGQSCPQHFGSFLLQEYPRALRVYIPVYLLPAILVHRRKLLMQPAHIGGKVLEGVARSSLFLTLYVGLAFAAACTSHQVTGTTTGAMYASFLWIPGLATLVEKKSRRMELALYCVARAVESYGRCLLEWGVINPKHVPGRLDVGLFSAAVGIIMHCYSDSHGKHRDVFRSKYLNILDAIFGNSGVVEGRIKHVPSNRDILQGVQHRAVRVIRKLGSAGNLQQLATSSPKAPPRLRAASTDSLPAAVPCPLTSDIGTMGQADQQGAVEGGGGTVLGEAEWREGAGSGRGSWEARPEESERCSSNVAAAADATVDMVGGTGGLGGPAPASSTSTHTGPGTEPDPSIPSRPAGTQGLPRPGPASSSTSASTHTGSGTEPEPRPAGIPGPPGLAQAGGAAAASVSPQPAAASDSTECSSAAGEEFASACETLQTWSTGSLVDVAFASASSSDVSMDEGPETPPAVGEGRSGVSSGQEAPGVAPVLSSVGEMAMAVAEAAGEAALPVVVADLAMSDAGSALETCQQPPTPGAGGMEAAPS